MMIDVKQFLSTIFESRETDEHILIGQMLPGDGGFRMAPHDSRAVESWQRFTEAPALYYNVSTVRAPEEEGSVWRRRKEDCLFAYVLVLEDVGTKAEVPPVQPSYKLESSAGNFQWGYLIGPTNKLERYEAIVDAVAELGYADKGAGGYNRLMRRP